MCIFRLHYFLQTGFIVLILKPSDEPPNFQVSQETKC